MTAARAASAVAAALVLLTTGCGAPDQDEQADDAVPAVTSATGGSTAPSADDGGKDVARTQDERGFLDELSRLGLPARTAADTTVEVGNGICRTLDEGVDTVAILDGIRPISSALAAQSGERDAQEAGRALVDASRAHLCG